MLGDAIKRMREAKGWSQQVFAVKAGIAIRTVSYAETNKSKPSYEVLCAMADALGCSLDELRQDYDEQSA